MHSLPANPVPNRFTYDAYLPSPDQDLDAAGIAMPAARAVRERAMPVSRNEQGPIAALPEAHSRVKRGCALGKPERKSSFRADRGGDQLSFSSWSCDPFDQADYVSRQINRRGSCEGWVREAIRRVDRDSSPDSDVATVVRQMRDEADVPRGATADELLRRVEQYQDGEHLFGLRRYVPRPSVLFNQALDRDALLEAMFASLLHRLDPGGLAHVRLGAVSAESGATDSGHAVLIQRLRNGRYELFDSNTGAFTYTNFVALREGFSRYLNAAFSDRGLRLAPDGINYYELPEADAAHRPTAEGTEYQIASFRPSREPAEPVARAASETRIAYRRSASVSNSLSSDVLSAAAGERYVMPDADHGLAMSALLEVARGEAPTLMDATENLRHRLSDWVQRSDSLADLDELQQENRFGVVGNLSGFLRRDGDGAVGLRSADELAVALSRAFGSVRVDDNPDVGHKVELAVVRLDFRGSPASSQGAAGGDPARHADGQSIVIQRLHRSSDYMNDQYELYDPDAGVFRYDNFTNLTTALRGMFDMGYRELGGIDRVSTAYYANAALPVALRANTTATIPGRSRLSTTGLYVVEPWLGAAGNPTASAAPDLPEPPVYFDPDTNLPEGPASKRSAPGSGTLKGLFRPSTIDPRRLRAAGGFNCEDVNVGDINLRVHDLDLATGPRVVDSAGYLGTFRSERTALTRMPCATGDGYIYYVAPTPNMVDVNATLGHGAHRPENEEFAAMGQIAYAQIRGWRVVRNGAPVAYVRNPEYRWDVYDQTSAARAQPALSRFPVNHRIWNEDGYRSFVTEVQGGGGTKVFNTNPDVAHALFYDEARQRVRDLHDRQAAGVDYRGPLRVQAYGPNDTSKTQIYLDPQNNVYV